MVTAVMGICAAFVNLSSFGRAGPGKGVMNMFGLGLPEMGVIIVIALFIFGPRRLPEIGNAIGKSIREFKGAIDGIEGNKEKPDEPVAK